MMEEDLRDLILGIAGVPSQVAWSATPQGQPRPAVILNTISDVSNHDYDGNDGSEVTRVQADAWADRFLTARDIARAIRTALDGFKGVVGQTNFTGIYAIDGSSSSEDTGAGIVQRSRVDLLVHHTAMGA